MNSKQKLTPVWLLVVMDIVLAGVGLCVFAFFHHVRPQVYSNTPTYTANPSLFVPPTPGSGTPGVTGDGGTSPSPTDDSWAAKWPELFTTDGSVEKTDTSYKSGSVNIQLEKHVNGDITYFVQDIHIASIYNLKTAFARGSYGKGLSQHTTVIANENNAIGAINGDYYGARDIGTVLRNGVLYREVAFADVCVLYYNGSMQTFSAEKFSAQKELNRGAYQVWSFGPMLLTEGMPMTEFAGKQVNPKNPRTAIGYYEPGHYCFVTVDGRQGGDSGMTTTELSQLMHDLGCMVAYNLDGGATATMTFNGNLVNDQSDPSRHVSDIVYICETE